MTNPPPVAPVEGHYALLECGWIMGPMQVYKPYQDSEQVFISPTSHFGWDNHGACTSKNETMNIIATISPADMQAVASGELERLRAALTNCLDWMETLRASGDAGFWEWDADHAYTKARAALQGDAP